MKEFIAKWKPKDFIALVALMISGGLMLLGHNHSITTCFAAIIAAYIGLDVSFIRRKNDGG